jgi:hypothetical protein
MKLELQSRMDLIVKKLNINQINLVTLSPIIKEGYTDSSKFA